MALNRTKPIFYRGSHGATTQGGLHVPVSFHNHEDGVRDYVERYLSQLDPYR